MACGLTLKTSDFSKFENTEIIEEQDDGSFDQSYDFSYD